MACNRFNVIIRREYLETTVQMSQSDTESQNVYKLV